jgi:DNA-binding NtrC family response regulator
VPRKLLIVDDEEPILFAMREYFTTRGFEVDCARELEEAEALITNLQYDLVIADLRLSGIQGAEGLELVAFVRQRCFSARIIIMTAYGTSEMEGEADRLGVDCFLHKPVPLPQMAQIVDSLLGSRICA